MFEKMTFLLLFVFLSVNISGQDCDAEQFEKEINQMLREGLFSQADSIADNWYECATEQQNTPSAYSAGIYLFQINRNKRKYKTAYKHAKAALEKWKTIPYGEHEDEGLHHLIMADAAILVKKNYLAKKHLLEAKKWLAFQPEKNDFLNAHYAFVNGFYHQHGDKQYDLTRKSFRQALTLLLELPQPPIYLTGQTLRWLGTTNRFNGDFEKSLYFYQRELSYYEAAYDPGHRAIANTYYNIGALQYELLRYEDALASFLKKQ